MTEHRYQGYEHPELYKMINNGPGVSASIPVERGWKTIADTLAQIDSDLHHALSKMGADWESDASDAAQGALSPLAQWAGYANTGASTMESSARYQGEFIADARKKMPEPKKVTTEAPGPLDMIVGGATGFIGMAHVIGQQVDHERQEAAKDNAAAQAVKVMEDYESDSRWNSSTLGDFPEPPQVVIDTPPPGDTGTSGKNVGYTSTGPYQPTGTNNNTTTPSWTPPPSTTSVTPPTTLPPTDTTHTSWTEPPKATPPHTPPHLPPTNLPTTEQPQNRPTPTPGPVFTRPTTGVPGGGTGGGRGGGSLGGAKPFGSMSGSLGSGQSGLKPGSMPMSGMGAGPDAMRGGPAGAGGAAGKAGAAGGMGAGGAGAQKGQGEDDIEHKAADYLVETDDVFGDDRMVAPPVIGGFAE